MAFISMYPPSRAHLSITINNRAYTSIGGAAVEVEDFDAPVLEANGWTTTPTASTNEYGTPIVEMVPPNFANNSISVDDRIYASEGGSSVEVLFFDAPTLLANGWTVVYSTAGDEGQFDLNQTAQSGLIWPMYGI